MNEASGDLYRPRVLDNVLADRLQSAGAVLIEGPKACGKTSTARRAAASVVELDSDRNAREALRVDPALALDGSPPLLIDEWQVEATEVWNFVRREVDRRRERGQFILTGSAVPDDDAHRHTGAGRFARLRMRPLSLLESGHSTGRITLSGLLARERPSSPVSGLTVPDLADAVVRGGWPMALDAPVDIAMRGNRDYLANIAEVDLSRLVGGRRNPRRVERLMHSLARNTAMEHKVSRLSRNAETDGSPLSRTAAYDYLEALERLFVIENQPAWSTHLRSRATLRTAARTHFVDPSLAAALLGAAPTSLLKDIRTLGLLFESLVLRDLRIYADPLDGHVWHYRDSTGLEVDMVVTTPHAWGAFEVKLGTDRIEQAAAQLLAFAERIDTTIVGEPAVLGVITGTGRGYTRADGVVVVPIGALGP